MKKVLSTEHRPRNIPQVTLVLVYVSYLVPDLLRHVTEGKQLQLEHASALFEQLLT